MIRQEREIAHEETLTYRPAPSIIWTRELDQTLLIDRERGTSWTMRGTEAVVWDLLVLAYPYPRIVALLSVLQGFSAEEARGALSALLVRWQGEGLLEISGNREDGKPGDQRGL
jgi:hypothetical protein